MTNSVAINVSPTVSVVITCYNYGKYLKTCLDSVFAQTFKDYEVIVINDGSTDNTHDVMKEYRHIPNLKYINQDNAGQAKAKNAGIKNSNGEYIAFLDADDKWCNEKLEKQMKCFANGSVGVVYCKANYLDANNEEFEYEMSSPYLQPRRGLVTQWLIFDNFVQFSSSVVRKECFDRFGLFDETLKMGIDWDLWLRISTEYQFEYVEERLFYYRMGHSGQMSKNMAERHRCSEKIMDKFLKAYPNAVSNNTVNHAFGITYCNRGEYYRNTDIIKSTKYFIDAIKIYPLEKGSYKGIVKNFLSIFGKYSSSLLSKIIRN